MYSNTLSIAHELLTFSNADVHCPITLLGKKLLIGTYTVLDNDACTTRIELLAKRVLKITTPQKQIIGKWHLSQLGIFDTQREIDKYEKEMAEYIEHKDDEENAPSKPHPPYKFVLIFEYDGQKEYYRPIFKMHGIIGLISYEHTSPFYWTKDLDQCIFLSRDNYKANYALYARDIPRTWNETHELTTAILEVAKEEKEALPDNNYFNKNIESTVIYTSVVLFFSIGVAYFCNSHLSNYFISIGLTESVSSWLSPTICYLGCILPLIACASCSGIANILRNRKKKSQLINYYNRYRSDGTPIKNQAIRILQNRNWLATETSWKHFIFIFLGILYFILSVFFIINY